MGTDIILLIKRLCSPVGLEADIRLRIQEILSASSVL